MTERSSPLFGTFQEMNITDGNAETEKETAQKPNNVVNL